MHHCAKLHQYPSISCGIIAIFFNFSLPSWIFNILHVYGQMRSGVQVALLCQILSKSVKQFLRYHHFLIFQDGGHHHLGFQKFSNFISSGVSRAEMHHRAKFHQNRSICRDIAIFQFLKMVATCHLGFLWGIFGPPTKGIWQSLSLCKIWLQSMQ